MSVHTELTSEGESDAKYCRKFVTLLKEQFQFTALLKSKEWRDVLRNKLLYFIVESYTSSQ